MNGAKSEISDLDKIHIDGWNSKAKKEATSYIKDLKDFDFPFIVGLTTVYSRFIHQQVLLTDFQEKQEIS